MCKWLARLGNDHKAPCLEKTWAVAADIETEWEHSCKRKFGPKIAQVEDAKPLFFSNVEECNGEADKYMVGGTTQLPPFVAVMQHCDAPASNGLQRSGSGRLPGAAGSSSVGAAETLLHGGHFSMEPWLPLAAWKPRCLLLLQHPKDVVRFKLRSNLDLKFRSSAMDS